MFIGCLAFIKLTPSFNDLMWASRASADLRVPNGDVATVTVTKDKTVKKGPDQSLTREDRFVSASVSGRNCCNFSLGYRYSRWHKYVSFAFGTCAGSCAVHHVVMAFMSLSEEFECLYTGLHRAG